MAVFARYGTPKEIFTDQGTNFTTQLLKELYSLIGIAAIRTMPYHSQTNGMVECFNRALQDLLRTTVNEEGQNWDKLLPHLMFAYREVQQASTGFSPFKLIFRLDVRGLLDVLKETWTSERTENDDILLYIIRLHNNVARKVVMEDLRVAQPKQKSWYDRKLIELKLNVCDEVLVLLQMTHDKLTAQWQGPFEVTKS